MSEFEDHRADSGLGAKLRRRLVRLYRRREASRRPDRPMVTFSFDDAPASAFRAGAAVLESYNCRGVFYVSADLLDRRSPVGLIGSDRDIARAVRRGHEIGCHTYGHLDCAQVSEAELSADLARNAKTLLTLGVPEAPSTFAYPYGEVTPTAKRLTSNRFQLARALHPGLIEPGVDLNQAPSARMEGPEGEAAAMHWLERAQARCSWIFFHCHGVQEGGSEWSLDVNAFRRIVGEAVARKFDVVTAAEGARRMRSAT